jgi:hypothetical protein
MMPNSVHTSLLIKSWVTLGVTYTIWRVAFFVLGLLSLRSMAPMMGSWQPSWSE